jgi:hypothetical protein
LFLRPRPREHFGEEPHISGPLLILHDPRI